MSLSNNEKDEVLTLITNAYDYIAFFANYDTLTGNETFNSTNFNELGRVALSNKTILNGLFTADYTLTTSDANCPVTTVATYAGNTTTLFKVASSTNLKVGDRIQVGNENDRKIIAKDGTNHYITVDAPLSAIPSVSTSVKVKISNRAFIRGGSGTAYSGEIAFIEKYILYKSDTISKKGRVSVEV